MISQIDKRRDGPTSELDFETNIRGEIWSVPIGQKLGIDVDHVEDVVRRAIDVHTRQCATLRFRRARTRRP